MDFSIMEIGRWVTITKPGVFRGVKGVVIDNLGDGWYVVRIRSLVKRDLDVRTDRLGWMAPFRPHYLFNRRWGEFK